MSTTGFYPPLFYRLVGWGEFSSTAAPALPDASIHSAAVAVRRGCGGVMVRQAAGLSPWRDRGGGHSDDRLPGRDVNSSGLGSRRRSRCGARCWPCSSDATAAPVARCGDRHRFGFGADIHRTFSPATPRSSPGSRWVATASGPRELLRRRDVIITYALLAVAAVAATGLIVASGQFDSPATSGRPLAPGETPLSAGLGMTERIGREIVAVFGWLDTGTAQLSYYVWIVACGSLVMGAVLLGRRRALSGLALAALATFVLPIAANWGQARTGGFVWQGRYSLPLAVGVPILAALICDQAGLARRVYRRFATTLGVLVAVGQTYAAYWALRRFAVGLHGSSSSSARRSGHRLAWGTTATMVAVAAVSAAVAATLVLAASASAGGGRGRSSDDSDARRARGRPTLRRRAHRRDPTSTQETAPT